MPLSPAPLMPGHSPLPAPGERPTNRMALRLGAVVALLTLGVALVPGQLVLSRLIFLTPGLLAQASSSQGTGGGAAFQGFTYLWTRQSSGKGGFTTPGSLQNMQSEAHDFHMNTVVIPVVADMPRVNESTLYWHSSDSYSGLDTLSDSDYLRAIDDARKAGLEPVLEIEVIQKDKDFQPDKSPLLIGSNWYSLPSTNEVYIADTGGSASIGDLERGWVDNYTAFAVHVAQLAQQKHVQYLIIGDQLGNITSDGPATTASADPAGIVAAKGDTFDASKCSGRHECEWRHIIHAIRAGTYSTYMGGHAETGASYTGKLIYAASWTAGSAADSSQGEFETIRWWDAVDAIGIDAFFPLTSSANLPTPALMDAWHGKGSGLKGQGDIFSRIQAMADKYNKPVLFTAAGYESVPGSNGTPSQADPTLGYDPDEQLTDMQALLQTFVGTPWWVGAIWYYDQPLVPRSSQSIWQGGTQWAGDNLQGSKPTDSKKAGVWLSTYYHSAPVPCLC
jgi:hypothetical protein